MSEDLRRAFMSAVDALDVAGQECDQLQPGFMRDVLSRHPEVAALLELRKNPEAFACWLETGER